MAAGGVTGDENAGRVGAVGGGGGEDEGGGGAGLADDLVEGNGGGEAVIHDCDMGAGGDQAGSDEALLGFRDGAPIATVKPEDDRAARSAGEPVERHAGGRVEDDVLDGVELEAGDGGEVDPALQFGCEVRDAVAGVVGAVERRAIEVMPGFHASRRRTVSRRRKLEFWGG